MINLHQLLKGRGNKEREKKHCGVGIEKLQFPPMKHKLEFFLLSFFSSSFIFDYTSYVYSRK